MENFSKNDSTALFNQFFQLLKRSFPPTVSINTEIRKHGLMTRGTFNIDKMIVDIIINDKRVILHIKADLVSFTDLINRLFKEAIGNIEPTFQYFLSPREKSNKNMIIPAYEWTTEERKWLTYAEIISGVTAGPKFYCRNVVIDQDEVPKYNGIYPGIIKSKLVHGASEEELFILINLLDNLLCGNFPKYNIRSNIWQEIFYAKEYCINQLRRYGLKLPAPGENISYEEMPIYQEWYKARYFVQVSRSKEEAFIDKYISFEDKGNSL